MEQKSRSDIVDEILDKLLASHGIGEWMVELDSKAKAKNQLFELFGKTGELEDSIND